MAAGSIDGIARRLEHMPAAIKREALRPAAKVARVVGYREGAAELGRETGIAAAAWKRHHRVYTSIQPGGVSARLWMGIAAYPTERRQGGRRVYAQFPAGYDPATHVGPAMEAAYVRVAEAEIREILGGES